MTTNLIETHAVEVTITTQKDGRITVPIVAREFLNVRDDDHLFITKGNGERGRYQLVSGGELLTYDGFLPGEATVRIKISKEE